MNAQVIFTDDDGGVLFSHSFFAVEKFGDCRWKVNPGLPIVRNGIILKGFQLNINAENLEERPISTGERSGTERL